MNRPTVLTCLFSLGVMACMMWGCNSLGDAETACLTDTECDTSWQQCDSDVQLCVRRQEVQLCEPKATPEERDPCGVGATCQSKPEGGVCITRPLRIGYLRDAGENPPDANLEILRIVFEHVAKSYFQPKLQEGTTWQVELVEETSVGTPESDAEITQKLLNLDVDMIITRSGDTYQSAQALAASKGVLVLGFLNRDIDTVLKELEDPSTIPPLDQRHDYSLVPIQNNDVATIAQFATENLGCTSIISLRSLEASDGKLYQKLLEQESPKHNLCVSEPLDVPYDERLPSFYRTAVDRLNQVNQPTQCILTRQSRGTLKLLSEWRAQADDPKLKVLVLRSSITTNLETFGAFMKENPETFIEYSYGAENERLAPFLDRFIRETYAEERATLCKDEDPCSLPSPDSILQSPLTLAAYTDMITTGLLTTYHSQARHGRVLAHDQLRDSFLALIDPNNRVCRYPDIARCLDLIDIGSEVHYDGLFSPMVFDTSGRVDRIYETMNFWRWNNAGQQDVVATFSSKQMLQAQLQPLPDNFQCMNP